MSIDELKEDENSMSVIVRGRSRRTGELMELELRGRFASI
jgi:hypothetical protein